MKQTIQKSSPTKIGFVRSLGVGLAVLLALSVFGTTWAAAKPDPVQRSLPRPPPQPGVVDLDACDDARRADADDTRPFTASTWKGTGGRTRPRPEVAPLRTENCEHVNVLLLGIDERTSQHGPSRADTIIVLTVDPATKHAGMLSIPRDLWVSIPVIGDNRINTAHFFGELKEYPGGGPALMVETMQENFGIAIHHYVRVNFVGFEKVIDTIGGVDIDVPRGIDLPKGINRPRLPDGDVNDDPLYIPAGHHHMDGKLALKYARTRLGDNDFYRMRRQQQVILAARDRVRRLGWFRLLLRLPQLMDSVADAIQTDIPLRELVALARLARQIDRDHIEARTIDPSMTVPVTTSRGADVLWPDWDRICPLVDELFGSAYSRPSAGGQACGREAVGCCRRSAR